MDLLVLSAIVMGVIALCMLTVILVTGAFFSKSSRPSAAVAVIFSAASAACFAPASVLGAVIMALVAVVSTLVLLAASGGE